MFQFHPKWVAIVLLIALLGVSCGDEDGGAINVTKTDPAGDFVANCVTGEGPGAKGEPAMDITRLSVEGVGSSGTITIQFDADNEVYSLQQDRLPAIDVLVHLTDGTVINILFSGKDSKVSGGKASVNHRWDDGTLIFSYSGIAANKIKKVKVFAGTYSPDACDSVEVNAS